MYHDNFQRLHKKKKLNTKLIQLQLDPRLDFFAISSILCFTCTKFFVPILLVGNDIRFFYWFILFPLIMGLLFLFSVRQKRYAHFYASIGKSRAHAYWVGKIILHLIFTTSIRILPMSYVCWILFNYLQASSNPIEHIKAKVYDTYWDKDQRTGFALIQCNNKQVELEIDYMMYEKLISLKSLLFIGLMFQFKKACSIIY